MSRKVSEIAQLCLDAFYQDFKTANEFFTKEHFVRYCILADAKLKQDEYALQVINNIRLRRYNAPVVLNSDNYYTAKDIEVKDDKALLPLSIMSFPGIGDTLSVSRVVPEGNCQNLMRVTQAQRWQICDDKSMVYWIPACDGIEFVNKKNCSFKKVDVTYIPQLTSDATIQDSRAWVIVNMVSGFLKAMKDGIVIDKSNDGNNNKTLQTEMNADLIKALQK